ncbi:hypothetical protein ES703_43525 [subsurface metagenome]
MAKEWMLFTKSWTVHKPPPRRKEILHPAKFPETLIKEFIEFFTQPSEIVLDPFLGTGSTLVACEDCKRQGIGVEIEEKYVKIAQTRTTYPIILGDAMEVNLLPMLKELKGEIDFVITSPPYWNMLKHSRGGVESVAKKRKKAGMDVAYEGSPDNLEQIDNYEEYLEALYNVFLRTHSLLKNEGYLVIIVQNVLTPDGVMKPIAWDLARKLNILYTLKQEKIWCQDNKSLGCWGYPVQYVSNVHHHYCLIFKKVKQ